MKTPKVKADFTDEKVDRGPVDAPKKKYACARWPFMRVGGGLKFQSGYLLAEGEDQIKRVERTDAFLHGQIIEIRGRKPGTKLSLEEATEMRAVEEINKLRMPRARRGAISTATYGQE